jgi:hypothetical protein
VTLTSASTYLAGSAWNVAPINLTQSFNMTFKVYLGAGAGGSGLDFVLQNAPSATAALGSLAQNRGYAGSGAISPSVAFDLSTYNSNGVLQVLENGNSSSAATCPNAGTACPYTFASSLSNNAEHSYQVVWDAANKVLSLIVDGGVVMQYDRDLVAAVFGANPVVYYGFTAATGSLANLQYVYEVGCTAPTHTVTSTPSNTQTATPSASPTDTPTASPTATPSVSPSTTPTDTPSATPSATQTVSPLPGAPTSTSTYTPTATPSASPSTTPTVTQSASPSATQSVTSTDTPSASPTVTVTATPSGTVTVTPTASPTSTVSPTFTPCYQSLLAGSGVAGINLTNTAARSAYLSAPAGLAWGPTQGSGLASLYVADVAAGNAAGVEVLGTDGQLTPLGSGAVFQAAQAVVVDASGMLYVADSTQNVVIRVDPLGNALVVAGGGAVAGLGAGVSGTATSFSLSAPSGLALDSIGDLYIADRGHNVVRKVFLPAGASVGTMTNVAGTGASALSATSGAATAVNLVPLGLAADAAGGLYITDISNNMIWHMTPSGQISVLAGNGAEATTADGQPAAGNPLFQPVGVALDASGTVYFTEDSAQPRVRSIRAGVLNSLATFSAGLNGLAVGPQGLAVAEPGGHQVYLLGSCSSQYVPIAPPLCQLSQLVASAAKSGGKTPIPVFQSGAWSPIAAPNPVRPNGNLCVSFQEPVTGSVDIFTLDGRKISSFPVSGSQACTSAPPSPGIYFMGIQVLGQDGGNYSNVRKIAVVP